MGLYPWLTRASHNNAFAKAGRHIGTSTKAKLGNGLGWIAMEKTNKILVFFKLIF